MSLARLSGCCPALAEWIEAERPDWVEAHETAVDQTIAAIMRPRQKMRVDQVSDLYRYIPQTASSNPGKFRVATYEVARGPMLAVTEPGVRVITVAAATQLMKTSLLEATALYFMLQDPCPMILVEANEGLAKEVSWTKIDGMVENTPEASKIMHKSTLDRKAFLGGLLKIVTAQSENALKSFAARVSMCDEIDGYPVLPGGNAVSLTEERTSSFGERALNLRVCSPTVEAGNIWTSFMAGDQRLPYVACPHCSFEQVMRWSPSAEQKQRALEAGRTLPDRMVTWDRHTSTGAWKPETAAYTCECCGERWSEGDRLRALEQIRWRQSKPFVCCDVSQSPETTHHWDDVYADDDGRHLVGYAKCTECGQRAVANRHASFWANRVYSPHPLSEMVAKFEEASKAPTTLRTFVNGSCAQPWIDSRAMRLSADGIAARAEDYDFEVPSRVVLVTAGVDVQDDRLEVEVVGWGRADENWSLEYRVIPGKPSEPHVWRELDAILGRTRLGVGGRKFPLSAACIDYGGHNAQAVAQYCLPRVSLNRWATRGRAESGAVVAPIWPKTAAVAGSFQMPLYEIGTTAAKTVIANQLLVAMPGRSFFHTPRGRDQSWYDGLVSEEQVMKAGVLRWQKKAEGVRNEPLDCRVYALAALWGLRAKHGDPYFVDKLADRKGTPTEITDLELERFASADEQARIASEAQAAIDATRRRLPGKAAATKSAGTAANDQPQVANQAPDPLSLQPSGQMRRRSAAPHPSRPRKAPFRI